jgi:hypothetical protein
MFVDKRKNGEGNHGKVRDLSWNPEEGLKIPPMLDPEEAYSSIVTRVVPQ